MSEAVSIVPEDVCVYCGSPDNLTTDHVPPDNIFPSPKPSCLITVRACKTCNSGASKDDEHFRMMLCLSQDVGDSPEAQKNWPSIFRSLRRPEARGMTKALLESIRPVQAITGGGIHLGMRMGLKVNLERINRVVERTVRGLYFSERKQRLPAGYGVLVHCDETLKRLPPDCLEQLQQTVILPLAAVEPKIVAPGVFFYRLMMAEDNPAASAWALTFYERRSFLAITGPTIPPVQPSTTP
jgi:hypothetical protein